MRFAEMTLLIPGLPWLSHLWLAWRRLTLLSKMPDLWKQRGQNLWCEVDAKSLGYGCFWRVMLNKPLDWITPCLQSLWTESSMLCKPQCCRSASPCVKISKLLNFAIYRARIGWNATCSGQLDCLQHVALPLRLNQPLVPPVSWNFDPNKQDIGVTATRSWDFFCNVRSLVNVSTATRLMSQRPQREKLPTSPDPLRCDDHVIKRVVWQFCNETMTVDQQNYHAIWECCSQSGNCLPQFRHDSVTHWTKGSFGQSDCVTNLIDQNSICALNPRMWDDLNSNPWQVGNRLASWVDRLCRSWPWLQQWIGRCHRPPQMTEILEL